MITFVQKKQNNTYMFVKRLSYYMCFEKYTHKLGAMKQSIFEQLFLQILPNIPMFIPMKQRWIRKKKSPMSQHFEPWNDRSMSQFSRLGSLFWCPVLVGFQGLINQDLKNISGSVPYLLRQHSIFIINDITVYIHHISYLYRILHFTTHLWYYRT